MARLTTAQKQRNRQASARKAAATRAKNKAAKQAKQSTTEVINEMLGFDKVNQLRTVTVEFAGTPVARYAYLTRDDSITEGDYCVVISPHPQRNYSGNHASFKVAGGYPVIVKVTSIVETVESITRASKWIVQKVDLDSAIAEEKRRKEIALLDARIQLETRAALKELQLEQLRGLNPELDRLISLRQQLEA